MHPGAKVDFTYTESLNNAVMISSFFLLSIVPLERRLISGVFLRLDCGNIAARGRDGWKARLVESRVRSFGLRLHCMA